jgi:hypothetical protein
MAVFHDQNLMVRNPRVVLPFFIDVKRAKKLNNDQV